MNVREAAMEYEGSTTKNVADLECFDTQNEIKTFNGTNSEGKDYSYQYIADDTGTRFRVPKSVLEQLKLYLEEDPEQVLFKVKKSGEGMKTSYTVVPCKTKK